MKNRWFKWFRNRMSDGAQHMRIIYLRFAGVELGEDTFVSYGAWIDVARGTVRIGSRCQITNGCKILSHSAVEHRLHPETKKSEAVTVIGDRVFIGMNAIVLANVRIGDDCIVGAGAVVTKDVPSGSVVGGNPARVIRRFDSLTNRWCRVGAGEHSNVEIS